MDRRERDKTVGFPHLSLSLSFSADSFFYGFLFLFFFLFFLGGEWHRGEGFLFPVEARDSVIILPFLEHW